MRLPVGKYFAGSPRAVTGEPKNEAPFTHVVQAPFTHVVTAPAQQQNEPPFTRSVVVHDGVADFGSTVEPAGEPKNGPPFTRRVDGPTTTFVVRRGGGFDWTAAAVGAVVALGLVAVAAGAVFVVRGHESGGAVRA